MNLADPPKIRSGAGPLSAPLAYEPDLLRPRRRRLLRSGLAVNGVGDGHLARLVALGRTGCSKGSSLSLVAFAGDRPDLTQLRPRCRAFLFLQRHENCPVRLRWLLPQDLRHEVARTKSWSWVTGSTMHKIQ